MTRIVTEKDIGYIRKLALSNRISEVNVTATEYFSETRKIDSILFFPNDQFDSYASINTEEYGEFIQLDFKKLIYATHYSFKPHSSGIYQKNWILETAKNENDWVVQDNRTNDASLSSGKEILFKFRHPGEYRFFKFVNTGPNTYHAIHILYCRRFDIFSFSSLRSNNCYCYFSNIRVYLLSRIMTLLT